MVSFLERCLSYCLYMDDFKHVGWLLLWCTIFLYPYFPRPSLFISPNTILCSWWNYFPKSQLWQQSQNDFEICSKQSFWEVFWVKDMVWYEGGRRWFNPDSGLPYYYQQYPTVPILYMYHQATNLISFLWQRLWS